MFIGEIGINHNGDLNIALQLIKEAKRCGVDVVKFQKRNPDVCVPEHQKTQKRIWKNEEMTYLEYKYDVEFDQTEYDIINDYCKKIGIQWTVSVWDVDSVEFMKRYTEDIPFVKIPSACITDMELLNAVNEWGVPVIISDGMSTDDEVVAAFFTLDNLIGILHCNSSYPAKESELDLNVITTYKNLYPNLKIGYSGHEMGILPTMVAASLKADIIERHITLDCNMEGSDHKCSLDIDELEALMRQLQRIKNILGGDKNILYDSELESRKKLRR